MSITIEDYYRNGHMYLETTNGRIEAFSFLREGINRGLQEGKNISDSVASIRILKGYIKGDSFIFLNPDLPNASLLSKKKGEIREDAIRFLGDILLLVERVYIETKDANHKFDILYLLVKFMPDIPGMDLQHYIDLYLLMFHTLLFSDILEGTKKDISYLMDLIIKSLCRYDCGKTGDYFVRSIVHKKLLKGYINLYPPYRNYVKGISDAVKKGLWEFTPILFTDRLFYLLREYYKSNNNLVSFIESRCFSLFREKEEKDILFNTIWCMVKEKEENLKTLVP
jgi:hypothetical protein